MSPPHDSYKETMKKDNHSDTTERKGAMSEQRRERIRLEISREAGTLILGARCVAATSGEQIADAVGMSCA